MHVPHKLGFCTKVHKFKYFVENRDTFLAKVPQWPVSNFKNVWIHTNCLIMPENSENGKYVLKNILSIFLSPQCFPLGNNAAYCNIWLQPNPPCQHGKITKSAQMS